MCPQCLLESAEAVENLKGNQTSSAKRWNFPQEHEHPAQRSLFLLLLGAANRHEVSTGSAASSLDLSGVIVLIVVGFNA